MWCNLNQAPPTECTAIPTALEPRLASIPKSKVRQYERHTRPRGLRRARLDRGCTVVSLADAGRGGEIPTVSGGRLALHCRARIRRRRRCRIVRYRQSVAVAA